MDSQLQPIVVEGQFELNPAATRAQGVRDQLAGHEDCVGNEVLSVWSVGEHRPKLLRAEVPRLAGRSGVAGEVAGGSPRQ
jgi:hypothetical protein